MDTLHAQILWQVMDRLRDANQLEEALSRCLDLFCRGTGSDKGTIWMLDEQSGRTIATNVYGTQDATGESAGKGEGLVGRVIESGKSEIHRAPEVQNMKLAGVVLGVLMGAAIAPIMIRLMEQPDIQFVRPFHGMAWLIAAGLEVLFSVIINSFVFRKVKDLDFRDVQ